MSAPHVGPQAWRTRCNSPTCMRLACWPGRTCWCRPKRRRQHDAGRRQCGGGTRPRRQAAGGTPTRLRGTKRSGGAAHMTATVPRLIEQFEHGLDAPICLTWELTYACNLACVHCLSSSGRRDPGELTPAEARGIVDDMVDLKVFYVNIGGGEPMLRPDFFDLVSYAVDRKVGVKFSTNGTRLTAARSRQLAALDYLDVQISIDGATASTNDRVRGAGSFAAARTAMDNLAAADFGQFKISVVITRDNVEELDALAAIADSYGAQLRLTRLRPSGRAAHPG